MVRRYSRSLASECCLSLSNRFWSALSAARAEYREHRRKADEAAERKRKAEDGRKHALLTCRRVPREKPYSNMTIASLGLSPRTRGSLANFSQQKIMSIPEQPVYPALSPEPSPERTPKGRVVYPAFSPELSPERTSKGRVVFPAFSPEPSPERTTKGRVIRNKHGTETTIPRLQLGNLQMMERIPRVPEPLPTTRRHYQPSPQLSPQPSLKPVLQSDKPALSPRRCPGRENANTRFLRSVPQTVLLPWDLSPSRAAFMRSPCPKRPAFKPVHRKLERSRSLESAVCRERARRPQTHPLCHVSPPAPPPRRKMTPLASKQEAKKKRWFSRLIK
ncbi:MAG: hypothetical protein KVP17_003478 [Porospora cf. gigantea B]|uniref:uncharacterized protein n=1 Tax=Porospora cf. gigantea B TaxID=2853592 RepID=UPI003571B66E|nr:MAG: hypothetical protein KVP17_003478 [Porospora cf. gigantea B]